MLDIKFIKQNKEKVKEAVKLKKINLDVDLLLELIDKRANLLLEVEGLRSERNNNVEVVKKSQGDNLSKDSDLVKKGKEIKGKLKESERQFNEVDARIQELMLIVPNIPSEDTPIGNSDEDNVEIKRWGEAPKFTFPFKSHIEIGKDLDLMDLEAGVKVSGFRGYYLKNDGVLLHFAVLWYALNKLVQKGFAPFLPPTLVNEFVLTGSGHFPFGREEVYQIGNRGKLESGDQITNPIYLAGTSEPALLAYYSDKVLLEKELPIKTCGISQCYRSEIGSYGKDTKGLYRIHEFMKVEQIIICKADIEESNKWLEELRSISEEILQELNLPHRVLKICTGDMGAGKYKMYDIETWMPSRNAYGETHSDSNLTDWQTRRLNIKYLTKDGKKEYAFALNNTAIASPRILIAILENYQQEDGSIKIPEVLKPYMGNRDIIKKING